MELKLIGRKEKVSFPELGLKNFIAKVDTGAYTSSIHCHGVKVIEQEGVSFLKALFLDEENQEQMVLFKDYTQTKVRSSSGVAQTRYLVKTPIRIGAKVYSASFTLANRSKMKCPVLLGRKLLNKRFLVDVSQEFALQKS